MRLIEVTLAANAPAVANHLTPTNCTCPIRVASWPWWQWSTVGALGPMHSGTRSRDFDYSSDAAQRVRIGLVA